MEMLPLDESKSFALKLAAPLVEPSAMASWIERVEPENESGLETVVFCIAPFVSVERSVPVWFGSQTEVNVASVVVAFEKVLSPIQVLVSVRSVEEAAVLGVEVAITVPSGFTARKEPAAAASEVMARPDDVAFVLKRLPAVRAVEEAKVMVLFVNQAVEPESSVVVALAKVFSKLHVLTSPRSVVDDTVMFAVPSKETPLMVRAVSSAVAVEALPMNEP